ncbi:YfhD family protein [Fictibacillus terranigra]|uniref:YfhD family protein n=1 Tax=Fictibacillus terranigra TaxID=3058424 RepID=A0ABT8EBC5_9BACL|nr:YfhD family protein [Fictibacillus sp. CENA-BCM004]MDN4075227.1 YfhD family protein [Fictibacillus sp. CENA-BCM004]
MENEKNRFTNEKDGLTEADQQQPEGVDVQYSSEVADQDDREALERAEEADRRQLNR